VIVDAFDVGKGRVGPAYLRHGWGRG
jgi:hypothetical protein